MTLNPNSIPANPRWRPGPDGPKLRGREAHVWRVDYRLHRPAGFESLLSSFEHERALKFLQPGIRDRYVIRRGVLRILLGRYLGRDGGSVMIQCGPFGKPYLSPGQGRDFRRVTAPVRLAIGAKCRRMHPPIRRGAGK